MSVMRLWRGKPIKKLTKGLNSTGGCGKKCSIIIAGRSKGHKKLYRVIDFKRSVWGIQSYVKRIEYDPIRSGFVVLILYMNGILSYILAPHKLDYNFIISSGEAVPLSIGNLKPLRTIPFGFPIHNVELKLGNLFTLSRAAGAQSQMLKKDIDKEFVIIKVKKHYELQLDYKAVGTLGCVSNIDHIFCKLQNAGNSRHLGRRPHVRGVAMNPVDHPHGGGEGKTSGGRCSVSKWGWLTKGYKLKKKKC